MGSYAKKENKLTTEHAVSSRETLLTLIREKRATLAEFINKIDGRSRRQTNIAIICGAIAAALTAGPAIGGVPFSAWLTKATGVETPIWQVLCFGAMICSVAATIATNLSKTQDVLSKLTAAQACNARLEGLQSQVELQSLDFKQASADFSKLLAEIPFVS